MECAGVVYAKVPAGGLAELERAVKDARAVSHHSSPLGVLACDPAIHRFAIVDRWGKPDDMPIWSEDPDLSTASELEALSRAVGEVVAFYEVEEGSTMGIYAAWRDGTLVRDLEWAEDQWVKVEGEPQPWEASLFGAESLERALERARYNGSSEDDVRAAFAAGTIEPGSSCPMPEGMAIYIRTSLDGPAYGFEPWPRRKVLVEKNREAQARE
jgi:hypothetical protein